MERGGAWWARLPDPTASEPGFRRPVVIIPSNAFNRSRIRALIRQCITSHHRGPFLSHGKMWPLAGALGQIRR